MKTWMPVSQIESWNRNPRNNDDAVEHVARSLLRFGFVNPCIVWKSKQRLVAGHTRLKAVRFLSKNQPVYDDTGSVVRFEPKQNDEFKVTAGYDAAGTAIYADEPMTVPVIMQEFKSEAEANAYALADNKLNELADWSDDLQDILRELDAEVDITDLGWSEDALAAMLEELPESTGNEDEAPEVQEEAQSTPGEVYELGPHLLVCGDSTDPGAWELLFADGANADCIWTDPPYGVAYVGKTEDALTIKNDNLNAEELQSFLSAALTEAEQILKPGGAAYVAAPSGDLFRIFGNVLHSLDLWRHTLIWVKDRFVLGRCDYHYRHEAIFYGWKPGAAHFFIDDRTLSSVLEFNRPSVNLSHPTMKPIALVAHCIGNSTRPGETVCDPFGGSGSTMIAAASIGRKARLIELDPKYCDVIRRRWTKYAQEHGLEPGSGALYDE
jgi:site-specific DNA-methyltransferase (adenine-specific)